MADLLLAYQSLFAFVGINGLLALSVYATLSCGQLSLANAGFMAIGAYASAIITLHASGVPFLLALAASAAVPALVAAPLGLPVVRLAGGLEAHFTFMVSPGGYGFSRAVDMLVQAVVGGTAAFFGPVIGAAFLTVLPEVLRELGARLGLAPGPFRLFLDGIILLAVILYLPNGLASLRWRRRRPA